MTRYWTLLRRKYRYWLLYCMDDALACPSSGRASTKADCLRATDVIMNTARKYGLSIHPTKGALGTGSTRLCHLSLVIDTQKMTFGVPLEKIERVQEMAMRIINLCMRNRRQVDVKIIRSFVGTCQSLYLAVPDTRFRLWELHQMIAAAGKQRRATLRKPAEKAVRWWRILRQQLRERKVLHDVTSPAITIHTDASQYAWGATLSHTETCAGAPGFMEVRGFWDQGIRTTAHITYKELRTVREALSELATMVQMKRGEVVRVWTYNMVTMFVMNAMVSKSPKLMAEVVLLHR